jgi:hypothetical protein
VVDLHAGRFASAQAEQIIAQADFERVAQWSQAHDLDFLAFKQPHLHEPLHERILTLEGRDSAALAGP